MRRAAVLGTCLGLLSVGLLWTWTAAASAQEQQESTDSSSTLSNQPEPVAPSKKASDRPTVRLRIQVKGDNDKPVVNASVYVRYDIPAGLMRKDKLAELDLKTNGDGSARAPAVPQGKILIQVIAPGWHSYGKWYDVSGKDEDSIDIKLEPPHHWY